MTSAMQSTKQTQVLTKSAQTGCGKIKRSSGGYLARLKQGGAQHQLHAEVQTNFRLNHNTDNDGTWKLEDEADAATMGNEFNAKHIGKHSGSHARTSWVDTFGELMTDHEFQCQ